MLYDIELVVALRVVKRIDPVLSGQKIGLQFDRLGLQRLNI